MTYRHFNNETTRSSVIRAVADTENAAAWNRLFDLYAGFVYSIARRKGLNDADAMPTISCRWYSPILRGTCLHSSTIEKKGASGHISRDSSIGA